MNWLYHMPMPLRVALFIVGNVGALVLLSQGFTTTAGIVMAVLGGLVLAATWFGLTLARVKGGSAGEEHNQRVLQETLGRLKHVETPALLIDVGTLYLRQNKPKEAQLYLERALGHDPDNVIARYNLGQIYLAAGRGADAWKMLAPIYEKDADYDLSHIRYHVARAYLELDEADHAYSLAQSFLTRQPGHAAGLLLAGRCAHKLDKLNEAREYFLEVIDVVDRAGSVKSDAMRAMAKEARRLLAKLPKVASSG